MACLEAFYGHHWEVGGKLGGFKNPRHFQLALPTPWELSAPA